MGAARGADRHLTAPPAAAKGQRVSQAPAQEGDFKPRGGQAWTESWMDPGQGEKSPLVCLPVASSCALAPQSTPG